MRAHFFITDVLFSSSGPESADDSEEIEKVQLLFENHAIND